MYHSMTRVHGAAAIDHTTGMWYFYLFSLERKFFEREGGVIAGASYSLSLETKAVLEKIAAEDGISPEGVLEQLVKKEDESRHVVFQPGKGHVRCKCPRKNCQEPNPRPGYFRD